MEEKSLIQTALLSANAGDWLVGCKPIYTRSFICHLIMHDDCASKQA
jgi:hypothetical protein